MDAPNKNDKPTGLTGAAAKAAAKAAKDADAVSVRRAEFEACDKTGTLTCRK